MIKITNVSPHGRECPLLTVDINTYQRRLLYIYTEQKYKRNMQQFQRFYRYASVGHRNLKNRYGLGSQNQSVSGVTTICLTQRGTSPSHRVDQAVDCDLWNVVPLLFNGCAKLLDIGRNWNTLSYTSILSIPNMLSE